MNAKTVIQFFLIIVIIIISILFYIKYFHENSKNLKDEPTIQKVDVNQNSKSNFIDKINYISTDPKGNKYQITAQQAEINTDYPDEMFLKDIIAYVFIKDSDKIKITSDSGKYNTKNYDTIFSENVIIVYGDYKITGEHLDFSFFNNLGTISTNVVYSADGVKMFADKVEMNLTTKDTKIFMNESTKKILIKGMK